MDEQTIENIEKYLRGEMEDAQRSSFEEEISNNEQLANEVELARQGNLVMESFFEQQMLQEMVAKGKRMLEKDQLTKKDEATDQEAIVKSIDTKQRSGNPMVWLGIAASILLIITVAGLQLGWFNNSSGGLTPTQAVAAAYDIEGISNTGLLGSNDTDEQFKVAIQAFNQKDYTTATVAFQQLLADTSFNEQAKANLLLGLSFFELGQANEAINTFDSIPQNARLFYQEGLWYKAFALWNNNQQEQARQIWRQIAQDNNHPKTVEAQQLLERIE